MTDIPPDVLLQILQLGELDEESAALEAQMAQAQALMQGSGRRYSTGTGAALGGLADAINAGVGGYRTKKLQEEQGKLRGKKTAGRSAFAEQLKALLGGGAQPPGMSAPPMQAPQPLGYGHQGDPVAPAPPPFPFGYIPGRY